MCCTDFDRVYMRLGARAYNISVDRVTIRISGRVDKNTHLYIQGSTISYKDLQQLKKHYILSDGKIEQWQNKYFPNKK